MPLLAFVVGVDLSPPPDLWVPPNCKLEVDDVLKVGFSCVFRSQFRANAIAAMGMASEVGSYSHQSTDGRL